MSDSSIEKNYHVPYELFPTGRFDLVAELRRLRDMRLSAVGADVAAKMDRATSELAAADPLARMPRVGDVAPKFALPNQVGRLTSLDGLLSTGPAVVVFYRGVWCPFCSLTLRAYQQHLPELTGMGTSLVGISPQAPDDSLTTADRNELGFQVLSDVKGAVAAAYGLLYELPAYLQEVYIERGHPLPAFNRTDDWTLPIPATFVIGVDGEVRFAEAFVDYTYRTDPAEVIATVRRITGS